jgi:hypothetical protein
MASALAVDGYLSPRFFPLPCRARLGSRRSGRGGERIVGQATAHDAAQREQEPITVLAKPLVVAEGFFFDVAVQVVRLDADVIRQR